MLRIAEDEESYSALEEFCKGRTVNFGRYSTQKRLGLLSDSWDCIAIKRNKDTYDGCTVLLKDWTGSMKNWTVSLHDVHAPVKKTKAADYVHRRVEVSY
jgi:hypothetical protein